jgi:nucleotide sugar dehydrogenase
MTKLYENCQRMMGIAFSNEMADACAPLGIDPFEVARAAATKPFGYLPFTPSLGVGGHCIPVNPYYLLSTCDFPLLRAAAERMRKRPAAMARAALARLADVCWNGSGRGRGSGSGIGIGGRRPRVLVVGVAFKAGQAVTCYSPGLEVADALRQSGCVDVMFADPLVEQSVVPLVPRLDDADWTKDRLKTFDMIIVAFRQTGLDFHVLEGLDNVIVDMWCN